MPIAKAIVEDLQISKGHSLSNTLRAQLRSNYYIIGEVALVKSVIRDCKECRAYRINVKFQYPEPDPLSIQFNEKLTPLIEVGIDYAGPLSNKDEKRYILVFICLQTKVLRLEIYDESVYGPISINILNYKFIMKY